VGKWKNKSYRIKNNISLEAWVLHFRELLSSHISDSPTKYAAPFNQNQCLDDAFSLEDIQKVLAKLKSNKSPGPDGVPYEHFVNAPQVFLERLVALYNYIYTNGLSPTSFGQAIIHPIFKRGDKESTSNYRGISCLNSMAKIYTGLLLHRLQSFVTDNGLLSEYQAGFRPKYSSVDNLFVLFNLVHIVHRAPRKKKEKTVLFFLGFIISFRQSGSSFLIFKVVQFRNFQ